MNPFIFSLFISLLLISFTPVAKAGQLTLTNGDVIHGELSAIKSNLLIWDSELLGKIRVQKTDVKHFHSDATIPMVQATGVTAENCQLIMKEMINGRCEEGKISDTPLTELTARQPLPPPSLVGGDLKLRYNKKEGNIDSESLDFSIRSAWDQELIRHEVSALADTDKSDQARVRERYKADYQRNYRFKESWFGYGNLGYEKNRFGPIVEQYEVGTGLGHILSFDNQLQLNMQLGASYLATEHADGEDDNHIAGRWIMKLDWPLPDTDLKLFHHHRFLWPVEEPGNNQLETSSGLRMPLIGNLFSEFRYDFDYVNQPSDDQQHTDQEWIISLGYQW